MNCTNKYYFNFGCGDTSSGDASADGDCLGGLNKILEDILDRLKKLENGGGNGKGDSDMDTDTDTDSDSDSDSDTDTDIDLGGGFDPDADGDRGAGEQQVTLLGSAKVEQFYDVARVQDGYIACGHTTAGSSYNRCLLSAFDTELNHVKSYSYGGNLHKLGNTMTQTPDGNFVAVGYHYTSTSTTAYGAFLMAFDKDLELKTANMIYSSSSTNRFYGVTSTPSNFTGSAMLAAVGFATSNYPLIATYDKDYNVLTYGRGSATTGNFNDVVANKDGFVAVGYSSSAGTAGSYDGFIVEFDPTLNMRQKALIGSAGDDRFVKILKSSDGYVVAGYTSSAGVTLGGSSLLLLTLDDDFNVLKKMVIGGTGADVLQSFRQTPTGNYALAGTTASFGAGSTDNFLIVVDSDFNILQELVFGGSAAEGQNAVTFAKDGSYIMVGATQSAGAGGNDAYIARLRGRFLDLTGGLAKYPALRINGGPGFKHTDDFSLTVNHNSVYSFTKPALTFYPNYTSYLTVDKNPPLIVDPNAVTQS